MSMQPVAFSKYNARVIKPVAKFLAGFFAAIAMLLVIAILSIIIFSESLLRTLIEVKGSEFLERDIRVEGEIDVTWHWRYTRIQVENLRMQNAEGFTDQDMGRIESVDLHFRPLPLLRGKIDISELIIVAPEIYLERKSEDSANWQFSSSNQDKDEDSEQSRYNFPLIDKLQITGGHIVFNDEPKGLHLDLTLDSVTAKDETAQADQQGFEKGYALKGTGKLQGRDFKVSANGGSLDELRDSSKPFPLQVLIEMGETRISLEGKFQDPIKLEGVDAWLQLTGASLADLFYLTAIPLPPTPRYSLEGQLTKTDETWAYRDFKGQVGSSDLSGDLAYDLSGKRGFLTADLKSKVLNAADLGGFIGLTPDAEKRESDHVIPDVPLARERLLATDLDVHLNAEKLDAPNVPFKGMNVRFNLRDGILKLDPFHLVLADGHIEGKIDVDANPQIPPMKMDLLLRKLNLRQFFAGTRFEPTTQGLFGGKVNLAGQGESLADVLASSNGDLTLIMSGGEISLLLVEAADLDIGQALPLYFGKDKKTRIHCGVMDFDVKDGTLESNVVVMDTADSLLDGEVKLSLKDEEINARLDAKPKDTSLLSLRIPITIKGKLKSPSIGLDKEKSVSRSVAAIALGSLLTPFAALLTFVEDGDVADADCATLIKEARN